MSLMFVHTVGGNISNDLMLLSPVAIKPTNRLKLIRVLVLRRHYSTLQCEDEFAETQKADACLWSLDIHCQLALVKLT